MNVTLENVEPIYTTITTNKGKEVAALRINQDIYIISGDQPIDKELIGVKLPQNTYYITKADFKNTEINNPNAKGYVNVIFDNLINKTSSNLQYTEIYYNDMCKEIRGTIYKNTDKKVLAPYYLLAEDGNKYFVNYPDENYTNYFVYTNPKDLGLNKKDIEKEIGKNVVVSGVIKNNNEIVHPKISTFIKEKTNQKGKQGIVGTGVAKVDGYFANAIIQHKDYIDINETDKVRTTEPLYCLYSPCLSQKLIDNINNTPCKAFLDTDPEGKNKINVSIKAHNIKEGPQEGTEFIINGDRKVKLMRKTGYYLFITNEYGEYEYHSRSRAYVFQQPNKGTTIKPALLFTDGLE